MEYTDAEEFLEKIKEETFYGVPFTVVFYQDKQGHTISQEFLMELDPPPMGFRVEDAPVLAAQREQTSRYEVIVYHHIENGFDEKLDYPTLEEAREVAQKYVAGSMEPDGFAYEGAAVYDLVDKKYLSIYGYYPDEKAHEQLKERDDTLVGEEKDLAQYPISAPVNGKWQTFSNEEAANQAIAEENSRTAEVLTDAGYARQNLIPGETTFDLDGRTFQVSKLELDIGRVELRDVTFDNAVGFPIFRVEPLAALRWHLEKEQGLAEPSKPLTTADITHVQLEEERYSGIAREHEYRLSCCVEGVPDTITYAVSQHDDGELVYISGAKRDIWDEMSVEEQRKLETLLHRAVVFGQWKKEIEHSTNADELEVTALDYQWAEDLDLSDEQRSTLWNLIREKQEQFSLSAGQQTRSPQNFHITDDHLGEGGPKAKFQANVNAIRLLKELETTGQQAISEQQEVLSRYVGWGGLPDAFDPGKESWSKEYSVLKDLLTPEEYAAARASTLNAHYTSPTVIRAIYEAVGQMGFQTGNILEPSCGVGNFFGLLPENMAGSKLYGVELDSISGRIAQQLYPKANITVAGFETTDRRDFYDLAIGNVPFGQYQVNDKAYKKLGFTIHNYFFAKALDQVRPGGVVAFITSRYTMDAKDSTVRRYLAQRAELLGAIRLPNNAFKANAGTEVVSDIIFLQKRERPLDIAPDWTQIGQTEDGFTLNQYFIDHPEMVLGKPAMENTQYGRQDYSVVPIEGKELADQLHDAIWHLRGTYQDIQLMELQEESIDSSITADPNVKNYSYALIDGVVYYRENSRMMRPDLNAAAEARVKGMVELRDCVQDLIDLQMDAATSDGEIQEKQAELNRLYDLFSAKHGLINDRKNRAAFSNDSSYYLLCALEVINEDGKLERKADMFTKRTIKPHEVVTSVDTASEALAVSIAEKACVDMAYMEQLTGKSEEELVSQLQGVIFRLPDAAPKEERPQYVTADEYLSGNVREKLEQAQKALETSEIFRPNVEALEQAQPPRLNASEIDVRLGATWIDPQYIRQFVFDTFQPAFYNRHHIQINFSPVTSEWQVSGKSSISRADVAAYMTYGTQRASAYRILEDTLNLRDVRIYDILEDKTRVLNQKETMLAQQKQQAIKDAFQNWIWQDPQRRQTLEERYNILFNSTRPREYNGSHVVFGGMNPAITLRDHQKNAIAHVLYGGNTLLAHEVGAGKTFEMVAAAMESKRLGLCQKPLFVVPNHLTEQWAAEFLRLYPSAKILVTTKKDFETHNRKKFCGRIATGDYDAVIMGHSQFEKIPISRERQERLLQRQIDEIEDALAAMKTSQGETFSIKQMEKTRKSLQARLEKLTDTARKDDVVTFEQLGVDRLFVDESQAYKNLFLYTKIRNAAGLSTSEAQRSTDMFMKCQYMDELTGGRGVVFASGTPVSNSMTELYTVMRYLQYGTLKEKGMTHFDAWAATFGETTTSIELAPEGYTLVGR